LLQCVCNILEIIVTSTDVVIFKYFRQKIGEQIGVFDSSYCYFGRIKGRNIGFQEKRHFLLKMAKNRRKY
jgi:hypothetical protein